MNGLFFYLEELLIDIIWDSENLDQRTKRQSMRAISRFIWIQNDLITMHYASTWNKNNTCLNIPIFKLNKCFF